MPVQQEVVEGVAVLTLDRSDVLNAFDDELGAQALAAVEAVSADESVRCIVITGAGRAFSSGEDLGALQSTYERGETPELGDTLIRRYNPLIEAVVTAPKPVVAAVNGVAAGAGASLALACDFRIASAKAKLVVAFIKVGLVPDSGALWFLARMIGTSRAWQLAASGDALDAVRAHELGIFHEIAEVEDFEDRWRSFARGVAAGPTRAFALTKALLGGAADRSFEEQLRAEIDAQTQAGRTADHLEGVQAFLAKRTPRFTGK